MTSAINTPGEREALEAWAFNVQLECLGRPEEKIDVVMGGAVLDLRDLDKILDSALRSPNAGDGQKAEIEKLYHDLLYCVEMKVPGETRHETAKRMLLARNHSASAMSAGTAETAQQAQGEARQRGAGTADAQPLEPLSGKEATKGEAGA